MIDRAIDSELVQRDRERLLVYVSATANPTRTVRAAAELARAFDCEWLAVRVDSPVALGGSSHDRRVTSRALRLAARLGAEITELTSLEPWEALQTYARERSVRRLVLGHRAAGRFGARADRTLARLLREAPELDITVVAERAPEPSEPRVPTRVGRHALFHALVVCAFGTAISLALFGRANLQDVVVVYVLGVVYSSVRHGHAAALLTTALSVLALDFLFIRPYFSFRVTDPRDLVTIAVTFFAALVISGLTKRVRDQAQDARRRELVTGMLYAMSRDLAGSASTEAMLRVAACHLHDAFEARVAVWLPNPSGELERSLHGARSFQPSADENKIAEWVWQNQRSAGHGTESFADAPALFLLLRGSRGKVGILALKSDDGERSRTEQPQLLRTFAAQIGSALERGKLAEAAQRAQVEIETERMRSSLLSSVSHDLRTPLGVITGATSTLLQDPHFLDEEAKRDLLESAHEEAERLNRLVGNLLDMTRLAAGALRPKKEWHPLDEIVGVALNRLDSRLAGREVAVNLPQSLPPLPIDAVLIEQTLINLLENALRYTPAGSPIELSASPRADGVEVFVSDRGPGVPPAQRSQIFEKFYRARPDASDGGVGLGLAICRGIVEAHGGRIEVEERPGGGATFHFFIPGDGATFLNQPWPE